MSIPITRIKVRKGRFIIDYSRILPTARLITLLVIIHYHKFFGSAAPHLDRRRPSGEPVDSTEEKGETFSMLHNFFPSGKRVQSLLRVEYLFPGVRDEAWL